MTFISNYYYHINQKNIKVDQNDNWNNNGTVNGNGQGVVDYAEMTIHYDIWIYMSFYFITSGATIGLHSARRASSSRINVRISEVGSGATVMPTSSSSTVRLTCTLFVYHTKWVNNNDENYGSKSSSPPPPSTGTIVSVQTRSSQLSFNSFSWNKERKK